MPDHVEYFACLLSELTTSLCSLSLTDFTDEKTEAQKS